MIKMQGRPRGSKKETIILLNCRSWVIEVDGNFPSRNFMVKRIGNTKNHVVAYCGSLDAALGVFFEVMVLENAKQTKGYSGKFDDLRDIIQKTKREFAELLDVTPILKNYNKPVEMKTFVVEGSPLLIQPKPFPDIPNPSPDDDDEEDYDVKGTESI
jgi:hypothetical protein